MSPPVHEEWIQIVSNYSKSRPKKATKGIRVKTQKTKPSAFPGMRTKSSVEAVRTKSSLSLNFNFQTFPIFSAYFIGKRIRFVFSVTINYRT